MSGSFNIRDHYVSKAGGKATRTRGGDGETDGVNGVVGVNGVIPTAPAFLTSNYGYIPRSKTSWNKIIIILLIVIIIIALILLIYYLVKKYGRSGFSDISDFFYRLSTNEDGSLGMKSYCPTAMTSPDMMLSRAGWRVYVQHGCPWCEKQLNILNTDFINRGAIYCDPLAGPCKYSSFPTWENETTGAVEIGYKNRPELDKMIQDATNVRIGGDKMQ
jgi:hypothetical protein